jgi:hypothetical protein
LAGKLTLALFARRPLRLDVFKQPPYALIEGLGDIAGQNFQRRLRLHQQAAKAVALAVKHTEFQPRIG